MFLSASDVGESTQEISKKASSSRPFQRTVHTPVQRRLRGHRSGDSGAVGDGHGHWERQTVFDVGPLFSIVRMEDRP